MNLDPGVRTVSASTLCTVLRVSHPSPRRPNPTCADAAQVRIGTRGSPLALAQAHETKKRLGEAFEELKAEGAVEIVVLKTTGDMILDKVGTRPGQLGFLHAMRFTSFGAEPC